MNDNCLTCGEDFFSSPVIDERAKSFGRNFLYTVLVFAALCAVSYMFNA